MTRRILLSLAIVAFGASFATLPAPAAEPPIKVALLAPVTGNAAAAGHDMVNGWSLWWSEHNGMAGGRKIVTTVYDTGSNPARALDQARRAVEQEGAQMVVGPYLANEGLAVAPYLVQHRIPMFLPTVSADDLTQRTPSAFVLKVAGWSSSLPSHPAGVWAYEQGYRKAATLANQYAFGFENAGGFAQTFTEKGGKMVSQLWAPLGTTDYSPYLSQIQAANPDVVFVCVVGADAVHFLQQWSQFGLKSKIPLIGNETTTDQSNIRSVAPNIVEGIISFAHYAEGRDDKITRDFVMKYGAKENALPSYMASAFYTAGYWIETALNKVHGNVDDAGALLGAIRSVKLPDSILGPMRLDAYGCPIENVYLRKIVATSGPEAKYAKTWNVVLRTYPNVSQFWTYNPAEYLKQPVYSPTYQGYQR